MSLLLHWSCSGACSHLAFVVQALADAGCTCEILDGELRARHEAEEEEEEEEEVVVVVAVGKARRGMHNKQL